MNFKMSKSVYKESEFVRFFFFVYNKYMLMIRKDGNSTERQDF